MKTTRIHRSTDRKSRHKTLVRVCVCVRGTEKDI